MPRNGHASCRIDFLSEVISLGPASRGPYSFMGGSRRKVLAAWKIFQWMRTDSIRSIQLLPLIGLLLLAAPAWSAASPAESWHVKGKSIVCSDKGKVVRQFRLIRPSWDTEEITTKAFRSRVGAISDDKKSAVIFEYSYDTSTVSYFRNGCAQAWQKIYPELEGARQVKVLNGGMGALFDLLTIAHHDVADAQGNYLDAEAGGYKEGYVVYVSSNGVERLRYGPLWSYYSNIPIVLSPNNRFGYIGSGRQYLFFDLSDGRFHFYEQPVEHNGGKVAISDEGKVTITRRIGRRRADGSHIDDDAIQRAQRAGTPEYVKLLEGSTEIIETSHEYQF